MTHLSNLSRGLAFSALMGLAACATPIPDRVDKALTPTEHYQFKTVESEPEVRLAIHAQGISAAQAQALEQFADDWAQAEGGAITLRTPTGGPGAAAAFRTTESARAFLINQGVPADRLLITGYDSATEPNATLKLSFHRVQAVIPACGKSWSNLARSMTNDVQKNFGCATTANMAAQVANPADLMGASDTAPIDAGRRMDVLSKYRQGKVTSSEKDEQAKGSVAQAVK